MLQTKFKTNDEKWDYIIKQVYSYMKETDPYSATFLKRDLHQKLHVSKSVFWSIIIEILRGKHNNLLGIDARYFLPPEKFPMLDMFTVD